LKPSHLPYFLTLFLPPPPSSAPFLFLPSLLLLTSPVAAQWQDYLQKVLNPGSAGNVREVKQKLELEQIQVYNVTEDNWRTVLQDSNVDWLVLFTLGEKECSGCLKFDKCFNDTKLLLQDKKDIHFARVDCDQAVLLCSLFNVWGSRLFYITHTESPSEAVTVPGMPLIHRTHLRTLPFHREGAEEVEVVEPDGTTSKPAPIPDAAWIEEVVRNGQWRDIEEWDGYSQPFDGWAKDLLYAGWWALMQFGKIPPFVSMIGISFIARYITSRMMKQGPTNKKAQAPQPRIPPKQD